MSWSVGVNGDRGVEVVRMVEVDVGVEEVTLLPFAISLTRTDIGVARVTVPPKGAVRMKRIRDCDSSTCVSTFELTMVSKVRQRSDVPSRGIRRFCAFVKLSGGEAGR